MTTTFIVERKDLRRGRWIESPTAPLAAGMVRLQVESFALTSNNITYAAFGDAMSYWSFFPTADIATGCIPVWGFARVTESQCPGVEVGERCYGYSPMADEVVLQPGRIGPAGFVDAAAHRSALHPVYNQYLRCAADPLHDARHEAEQALLRPLFTTSFLIDDFLADNAFFGGSSVILSSASSKTAYGTAFCLARRRRTAEAVRIVGLTSPANAAYTRGLGCYDEVLDYDDIGALPADLPSVYVDMSGSVKVRAAVHAHLDGQLRYSCSVGGTHWADLGSAKGLAGPRPVLFFAPAQIRKRSDDWGPEPLGVRLAEAWRAFMVAVTEPTRPWLQVVRSHGRRAVEAIYRAQLDGAVPPREGHILSV
jgi:hypothetical protein